MDPSSPDNPHLERAAMRHVPFLKLLDIRPLDAAEGRATFEMLVDERHLRTRGILHGGVTAALLDTALGYAAGTTAPEGYFVVTVQLNLNYIRPAWESEKLYATGEVKHAGRQTAVAQGEIRTAENELIATASGTFLYVPDANP